MPLSKIETPIPVSQLILALRNDIERKYARVCVIGEISSFKPWRSGHWYFDLKDSEALIPAVMFKGAVSKVKFKVSEGLEVIIRAKVSVFTPQSRMQLIVESIEPVGVGALSLAFEQLKEKLSKEGLFEASHKKPIPAFPKTLGLVTSPQGAALQDMLRILKNRMPGVNILLSPARVQGQGSAEELSEALEKLDNLGECNLIIIGRGGGSLEDLWAFNEEILARAIYKAQTPIISAVGHEPDFSISDFVADMRCATPTHAAQAAVPDKAEILERFRFAESRLHKIARIVLNKYQLGLARLSKRLVSPKTIAFQSAQKLDFLAQKLEKIMTYRIQRAQERFRVSAAKLDSLSPLKVLSRGFSAVYKERHIVSRINQINIGEKLDIRLSDGKLKVEVLEKNGL